MPTQIARNDCPIVQQVTNITPTVTNSAVYDLKINTKTVDSYTVDGSATAQEIVEGVQPLLDAETITEFTEITWTEDNTKIIATGPDTGKPFTVTDGAGSGTWSAITTATVAKSPNHWIAENFSAGTLPATGEDIVLSGLTEAQSFYWSLDQNGVQLASLDLRADSLARIGLSTINTDGDPYYEYRETHLLIDPLILKIGDGIGEGARSIKIKLTGAVACDVTVYQTSANPLDQDEAPVHLVGGNAANTLQLISGTVDLAMLPGYTATFATLTVSGGVLRCGSGLGTIATVDVAGGSVETRSVVTTYRVRGEGRAKHIGSSNITTLDCNGAMEIQATGALTVSTLNGYGGKTLDLSRCDSLVTITNANIYSTPANPFTILDPNNKLVMTNAMSVLNGAQSLVVLSGSGRTVKVA